MDLKVELRTLKHQLYDAIQLAESAADWLDTPEGEKKSELEAELEKITRERDAAILGLVRIFTKYNKSPSGYESSSENVAQWIRQTLDCPQFDSERYGANSIAEMARMLSPDWGKE